MIRSNAPRLLLTLALVLVGCGDTSESSDSSTPPSADAPVAGSSAPSTTEGDTVTSTEEPPDPADATDTASTVPPADETAPADADPVEQPPGEQPPGDDEPREPAADVPDPNVPAGFEAIAAAARADLAGVLGVAEAEIAVAVAEPIVWPDAGLGCPEPEMAYAQVQVEGFRVVLTNGGNSYAYHGGGSRPEPFLCRRPTYP